MARTRKTDYTAKCPTTGFPRYNTPGTAWTAGAKIVRHPLDSSLSVFQCQGCRMFHYLIEENRG